MKIWIHKYGWFSKTVKERIKSLQPEAVKSIAVIKHGALGDLLMTRPFLVTLRQHFPNAKITLSIASHYQIGNPEDLVDHVHICFGKNERGAPMKEVFRNYKALGSHDLIFDITCNARSLITSILNDAQLKMGFVPRGGHRHFYKWIYDAAVPRTNLKFEAEVFLDQLHAIGINYDWPLKFNLPVGERIIAEKYILYFPGASDMNKCWPAEHLSDLIRKMAPAYKDYQHIILSGLADWELEFSEQIFAPCQEMDNVRLIKGGKDSFNIVSHADLLICNDTGIRNYAIAAGTPTVGIFFETNPFNYLPRFGHHLAAFEADGRPPEVTYVFEKVRTILEKLQDVPAKPTSA